MKKITCVDLPGPVGDYVATDKGLVPFDDAAAADLATDAMLLALAPNHRDRLLEQKARAAEQAHAVSHATAST